MIHRAIAALFVLTAAFNLQGADFTGRWEGRATLPDGSQFNAAFVFTAVEGGLVGTVETSEHGNFTASEIVVAGDTITFNVATEGGTYRNTGTLKPDGLMVEGVGPDGPLVPALYKRPAANLVGTWRGRIQTPDGPADIVYTFETRDGKITGTVSGPMGQAPLTHITIDGNRVAFESDYSGFTIKRRGTITGETMQLTITIDGNELSATLTREAPASPAK